MAEPVGLVGLGLMGTAMSGRLLAAGHPVVGFDVSPAAVAAHRERGGEVAASPAEVAARCGPVILSLPNAAISRTVCLDDGGVVHGAGPGTLVVQTSTVDPGDVERDAGDLERAGVAYLDVALSGHSHMVARGDTLAMIGGDAAAAERVTPVLTPFCRDVRHVGGTGAGMRAKLVVNHVLSLNRWALAEGLVFAEKQQLDPGQMLDVLQASAAASTAMAMWGSRMVEGRYTEPASRIRTHNKDAQVILEVGRRSGAPMPAMTQLNAVVQVALANDLGDADNAVIIEVLRRMAGLGGGLGIDPQAASR